MVNNELIINSVADSGEIQIALLGDKKLVEFHKESADKGFLVGDIYLGKVGKLAVGLNSAFINIGYEKDGFLHYQDLGPQFKTLETYVKRCKTSKQYSSSLSGFKHEKDIPKEGKINEALKTGQEILVQVIKEPISTKGPRITSEITLAGRYLVLVPFSDRVSISQKVKSSEEKERLKRLIQSIKPKNFGVIIRTVATDKKVADLDADLKNLMQRWRKVYDKLKNANPPQKILGELNRSSAILRDVMNSSFSAIKVNDEKVATELKDYLKIIAPEKEKIVSFYTGKESIFEKFGIEKQIKKSFGKHVTMKSGAYLVIEHTEALHVVDVNSGNTAKSKDDQETNALRVNLESADEVARQLRLRDMGGIIVVDFIDLHKAENRKELYNRMRDGMADDKAKHHILPPSKFGLIQITRQRVRPEMAIKTSEVCPSCKGSGEVTASVLFGEEIEFALEKIVVKHTDESITILVHPFVEAYIKKGYPSTQMKWCIKFKKRIKVQSADSYSFLEFHFYDNNRKELK